MKLFIEKLNRTVTLNDNLVKQYEALGRPVEESLLLTEIRSEFGFNPPEHKIMGQLLDNFCNKALENEISRIQGR